MPSVCQAAGQPEGDSEDVSARLQSDVESPLCPGCAGAGIPAGTPIVGTVGFLGLSNQIVAETSSQEVDFWGNPDRVERPA